MTEKTDRILITGASSGLGDALARHYAAPGRTLLLWGRNESRLAAIADKCRRAGAIAITRSLDLSDVDAAIEAVRREEEAGPIAIALLVAGLGDIRPPEAVTEPPSQVATLGMVNFVAPCAMAAALAEYMAGRRRGTIVFIGSAAAFHALPFAATYAASKAGLARFAQALRLGMKAKGVRVTLVSPGFIDTAGGRRVPGARPFQMKPAYVAARIARAVARGQAHLVLPWPFPLLRVFDRLLPAPLRDRLLLGLAPPLQHNRTESSTK